MYNDAHARVGKHRSQRFEIEPVLECVDDEDVEAVAVADDELDQAEQRPVAPLSDELRVETEATGRLGACGELC